VEPCSSSSISAEQVESSATISESSSVIPLLKSQVGPKLRASAGVARVFAERKPAEKPPAQLTTIEGPAPLFHKRNAGGNNSVNQSASALQFPTGIASTDVQSVSSDDDNSLASMSLVSDGQEETAGAKSTSAISVGSDIQSDHQQPLPDPQDIKPEAGKGNKSDKRSVFIRHARTGADSMFYGTPLKDVAPPQRPPQEGITLATSTDKKVSESSNAIDAGWGERAAHPRSSAALTQRISEPLVIEDLENNEISDSTGLTACVLVTPTVGSWLIL